MIPKLLLYGAEGLVILLTICSLFTRRIASWIYWTAFGIGAVAILVWCFDDPPTGVDLSVFHQAGEAALQGENPYYDRKMLSPPNALPFFTLFGLLPFSVCLVAWTIIGILGTLILAFLTDRVIRAFCDNRMSPIPISIIAVWGMTLLLSFSTRFCLRQGQLSIMVAILVCLGLFAAASLRHWWTGLFMALAAMKPATIIPFLILFFRRVYWKIWLTLGIIGLALVLICTPPSSIVSYCQNCLHNIAGMAREGHDNDSSYANSNNIEVLGADHALYRLGVHDRHWIMILQWGWLMLIGGLLTWMTMKEYVSIPCMIGILACFSMMFLYHRVYDAVILIIPFVYAARQVRELSGWARWTFFGVLLAILNIWYLRVGILRNLTERVAENLDAVHPLIQGAILPYGYWLLILASGCLIVGERIRLSHQAH